VGGGDGQDALLFKVDRFGLLLVNLLGSMVYGVGDDDLATVLLRVEMSLM